MTGGRKVDFVIEIGGRATLGKSIRSTKGGGLVAISGYMSDYSKPDEKANQEGKSELRVSARYRIYTEGGRDG